MNLPIFSDGRTTIQSIDAAMRKPIGWIATKEMNGLAIAIRKMM
jgi:hypothetical protein